MNSREKAAIGAGKVDVKTWAGVKWIGAYNVYRTTIAGWIVLQVAWEKDGYHASVCGKKLAIRFVSQVEAAEALINFVRESISKVDAPRYTNMAVPNA